MMFYPLSVIRLFVEFFEKEEEHDGVHSDPPYEGFGVIAVNEKQLEGVQHDENKLNLKRVKFFSMCRTVICFFDAHHLKTR